MSTASPANTHETGSAFVCAALGIALCATGAFFLFVEPDLPDAPDIGTVFGRTTRVVNLQRLTIGGTLVISGSIFLASAIRPRKG